MVLIDEIKNKNVTVGVIGLGYVGLPLAVTAGKAGFPVIGFEVQQSRADSINNGDNYIDDVEEADLKKLTSDGTLKATTDFAQLNTCGIIIIAVPTPLNKYKEPDITYILQASESIAENISKGTLVILESTTFPGTTEEYVVPVIERKGLKAGRDFHIAFSPERVDPGNKQYKTHNTPKVVGGLTPQCTELAAAFYGSVIQKVHTVSSPRVAEMEKLLENIFRIVNISMINELALLADRMDIDIWEVIEAAKTKPYGFMPFYPGPGAGGHCIPIDPFYLSWKAREYNFNARFIELAGEINDQMPHFIIVKTIYALNNVKKALNEAKVLVLGVAYKKDISDARETPAEHIISLLMKKHADVSYNDPYIPEYTVNGTTLKSVELNEKTLKNADAVIITTDHSAYDPEFIKKHAQIIIDTRNIIKSRDNENFYHL